MPKALLGSNLEGIDYLPDFPAGQKRAGEGVLEDVYGRPYEFILLSGDYHVFSAGANGLAGDEDDVDEWSYQRVVLGQACAPAYDPSAPVNRDLQEGNIRPNPVGRLPGEARE